LSSSWWANNIGTAATATTPAGGVPQYGLAATLGTSPGWDPDTFSTWAEDQVKKTNSGEIKQLEIQQFRESVVSKYGKSGFAPEGETAFKKTLSGIGHFFGHALGEMHRAADAVTGSSLWDENRELLEAQGLDKDTWDKLPDEGQSRLVGDVRAGKALKTPVIKEVVEGLNWGYDKATNVLETPLQVQRSTIQNRNLTLWWDPSSWGRAWRAAEDRTIGETLVDSTLLGFKSDSDLDRIRRTNNLYQMTSFGADFAASMYVDPGVVVGKGLGTAQAIARNELPRVGSKGATAALKVLTAENPAEVAAKGGIRTRAGHWRGQRMVRTFPELRQAAKDMDIADFQALPMFRRRSTNGGTLAYAFHYAAGDDRLWDLTRRASFGDDVAWNEIRGLKTGDQEILGKYQGSNPQTYIDALEASKTAERRLEAEVSDLQKQLKARDAQAPRPAENRPGDENTGLFRHYSWELDRSLKDKQADLADLQGRLSRYEDYRTWLENTPSLSIEGKGLDSPAMLQSVSARPERLNFLSRKTYKDGPFGAAHSVHSITKAGWTREASAIDLHRAGSGTESILRQFELYHQQLNYVDRDGLNSALRRFGSARDEFERFQVAREIEDTHLPAALGDYFGLEPETVSQFMEGLRGRRDQMVNALLSGEGSVYSTAPSILENDAVKLISRKDGYVTLEFADGARRTTMRVPEHALETQSMPVDPTQTPNYYQPLNIRDIKLAIRRDHELFQELESARKNFGRQASAMAFDTIDNLGSRFNHFWKPLQLFRLGWPQRVLMDESLRGLVQLGMGPFIREYGTAFGKASVNALNPKLHGPVAWRSEKRAFLKGGPGPITDELGGKDFDVALHDEILDAAPVVPERFAPKINPTRASALDDQIAANTDVWRHNNKREALLREGALEVDAPRSYDSPVVKAAMSLKSGDRVVIDPLSGNKLRNGYAVPVIQKRVNEAVSPTTAEANISYFVAEHRDLLASGNYRLMVDNGDSGTTLSVVRVFKSNTSKDAADFLQHVGAEKMFNLRKGGLEEFAREWDDLDPVTEFVQRPTFVGENEVGLVPGESPATGVGPVYHGTKGELPETLRPRGEVPARQGNMAGQGFYTTVDNTVAKGYAGGAGKLYTIRGSKSGKQYEVFDLDQRIGENYDDLNAFVDAGQEHPRAHNLSSLNIGPDETWIEAFSRSEWEGVQPLLTKYLEEHHGAGALTHRGGGRVGTQDHQVYVWLNPEDLVVRPAYDKTGKFHTLEDWLSNTMARERIVEENRIHRVGPKPREKARQQFAEGTQQSGRLGTVEQSELALKDLDFSSWDSEHSAFLRNLLRKREFGKGYISMKGPDGVKYPVAKPFEGAGEAYVPLVSSSPAYSKLGDRYKRQLSQFRTQAVGYKRLQPPNMAFSATEGALPSAAYKQAKEYYTYWADLLNNQVRNSPIWYKMLEGKSNDEIVNWLVKTPEGAKIRESLPHKGQHPEYWVEEHRHELDSYLPNLDMQRALAGAKIKPTDLRHIPDQHRPDVAAEDLEMISGKGAGAFLGRTADKLYHALGAVPTDVLNRQPFFSGMYKLKMKNLVKSSNGPVTNETLLAYEKLSREFALGQVRKTMFDLMDDTNMTQALRFVAPFWGAQQEALEKWFRMFVEKPEIIARFYAGTNLAYDRITIINEDGERVGGPRGPFNYSPNDRVVLQIPENLKKIAPFDKMLKDFGSVDFSIGSLNTSIQGENPLLPSLGPLVVVPANQAANMMWDTHAVEHDENFFYRWLFPVGRANGGILDQVVAQTAPGWGKRAYAWMQGEGSRSYMSTYMSVLREMELANKKKGLPPPTPKEVQDAVSWHMGLRVAGAFVLPVQFNFRPKHQFYLDEFHKMIRTEGPGPAFEKFVQKYGVDAAYFASSSSSSVGVPATSQGMAEWSKTKALIAKHPDWADAIISPDAWADDYSTDTYGQQFDIKLGPGSSKTLRTLDDADERQQKTDVRVGWLQYRQFMAAISAQLAAQGLTSLEQKAAEPLKQIKMAFVADLAKNNDAWIRDYNTFDNTIYQRVGELAEISAQPQFDNRPEFQGVRQYLVIRQQATDILDALGASGGSRSLQSQDNEQIRDWFYATVGQLVQANPAFGEFYTRWLETDRLERGSGP